MKRFGILLVPVVLLCLLGASAVPAGGEKELIIRLQGEVLVLQRQVRDLQESFDKSQGQMAALLQRLSDNSEQTQRALAGVDDTLKSSQTAQANNLTGATARLTKLAEQSAQSEQRQEQRFAQLAKQIQSLKDFLEQSERRRSEVEKAQAAPAFNQPEQLYAAAYTQFSQGNHEAAVANFRRYLDVYGHTEAADNAQFWIAESFYAQARYPEALREYDRLLTEYPKGDKAPAAYLKKGLTLLQLERRSEGVAALKQLIELHPQAVEAASAGQELTRLGEQPVPAPTGSRQRPRRDIP
jgi:tol-pal system protein YbgF